ncbi:Alpha/Beta hydrolase protein [Lipomyces japonicus]|uniref:Alpha/Beta hydrolase protein n=1 Tax=Lipomyces japonicus TaxID=56871 RepID=UPI0034CF4EA1
MIDHLLGRPSQSLKKIHVWAIALFWTIYIVRGPRHGPPLARRLSRFLTTKATAWQIQVLTLTGLYVLKNIDKLVNLASPEPLADIYSRNFFRAAWILTALDAGFWTAMPVRPKAVRDIASILFSIYYLIFADQADEKVRKVRATITAEHLRVSWEKSTTPYLKLAKFLTCTRIQTVRAFEIPRPQDSKYRGRIRAVLYYDGPRNEFKQHDKVLLAFPGGGFVTMNPRHHDDAFCAWAKKLKVPVVAIDYDKAPEYPYPYSLDECYDAYVEIARTKGKCVGLNGTSELKVVITGDSAGGNFATGVMLKLLCGNAKVPHPAALILIYPALDLNFTSWMTNEQVRLLRQESTKDFHSPRLLQRKESTYIDMSGKYRALEDQDLKNNLKKFCLPDSVDTDKPTETTNVLEAAGSQKKETISTSLAMTSRVSYFSDKIITPEMLRAMVILYIGPHSRPDFTTDYLLSPVNAPAELLAKFSKVYMICGEVDPLVDDTIIFAGRVREAKRSAMLRREALAMSRPGASMNERRFVEVVLIRGLSHGFMQIPFLVPEARRAILRCAAWAQESFGMFDHTAEQQANKQAAVPRATTATATSPTAATSSSPSSFSHVPPPLLHTHSNKGHVHHVHIDNKKPGLFRRSITNALTYLGLGWIVTPADNWTKDSIFGIDEDDDDYYEFYDEDEEDEDEVGDDELFPENLDKAELGLIEFGAPAAPVTAAAMVNGSGGESSSSYMSLRSSLLTPASSRSTPASSEGGRVVDSVVERVMKELAADQMTQPAASSSSPSINGEIKKKVKRLRVSVRQKSWDRSHVVQENELMDRRRDAVVRAMASEEARRE